jgi:hypothetical protein
MTITSTPRWSLSRGNAVVPSRWQATGGDWKRSSDWSWTPRWHSRTGNRRNEGHGSYSQNEQPRQSPTLLTTRLDTEMGG